jgi:hypothetical protein
MRILLLIFGIGYTLNAFSQNGFSFVEKADARKLELLYDGKLITSYCYFDSTEKPVLFPIKTFSGITITRGYPIAPREGERTDHPHHVGLWFNYESVNGLDFWNNSSAISSDRKHLYGSIRHQKILSRSSKKDLANLKTTSQWVNHTGKVLLDEVSEFVFSKSGDALIIDRLATLTAKEEVLFKDVKDGMIAIRVARELEMPSQQQDKFVDAHGNITDVPKADINITGLYVSKEGVKGDSVWGKRSAWTYLTGEKHGKSITIAMIDHPKNIGYPTYWHARGYGLYAANPLGQKVFSKGKEELNFNLKKDESVTFRYRIVIKEGVTPSNEELNKLTTEFSKQ